MVCTTLRDLARFASIVVCSLAVMAFVTPVATGSEDPPPVPPRKEWIVVKDVMAEYTYVRFQRSEAGGRYEVVSQCTGEIDGAHYDQLVCRCTASGKTKVFTFDITRIVEAREFAASKKAKAEAYAALDKRYPEVTAESLPEIGTLLKDDNPHFRTWAIERLGRIATPASDEILLAGYVDAGFFRSWRFAPQLVARGDAIVGLVEHRLREGKPEISWNLLDLLGQIPTPKSARVLEGELRFALKNNRRDRRPCYIAIGEVGDRGSERLLLEALRDEMPEPDDSLIWALGRCGSKRVIPQIRELLDSPHEDVWVSAIAALGMLGDRESIPRLFEFTKYDKTDDHIHNHTVRHNAIFALGQLKAKEAVPLMIEYMHEKPKYKSFISPVGQFGRFGSGIDKTITGSHVDSCIVALTKMEDKRALPEFRRILKDDDFYLNYDEVARAAAELGWRELIPDIIDRLEKDYEYNVELFGEDKERYSPALRKLTGQSFSEDPREWRAWLERNR